MGTIEPSLCFTLFQVWVSELLGGVSVPSGALWHPGTVSPAQTTPLTKRLGVGPNPGPWLCALNGFPES